MLERLFHPGTFLVIVGAVLVYGSGFFSDLTGEKHRVSDSVFKGVGCMLAVVGAGWLFLTT